MRPGDELVLRESNERVVLVAVLNDAAGALLVAPRADAPFEVRREDVMTLRERHASCGCC